MLPTDLAFVFEDLGRMQQTSCVEISREGTRIRNARGVAIGTRTPIDGEEAIECWLTNSVEQVLAAGFGGSDEHQLLAVFLPGTNVRPKDVLTVLSGCEEGAVFRVLDVHGLRRPGEPVTAMLERQK